MGGTHFLQTGYLLLNRNAPYYIFMISYISDYNNFPVKIPSF